MLGGKEAAFGEVIRDKTHLSTVQHCACRYGRWAWDVLVSGGMWCVGVLVCVWCL